jgi:hypothetical protein
VSTRRDLGRSRTLKKNGNDYFSPLKCYSGDYVATQISTHRFVALWLTDNQDGAGPMASEIAMPLKSSATVNVALIMSTRAHPVFSGA